MQKQLESAASASSRSRLIPPELSDISAAELMYMGDVLAGKSKNKAAVKLYRLALALCEEGDQELKKILLSQLQALHIRPLGAARFESLNDIKSQLPPLRPASRRLLLLDNSYGVEQLEALNQGADTVHILKFTDLYGFGTDLSKVADSEKFEIEHARTRITRFSQRYCEIHDLSRQLADDIVELLYDRGLIDTLIEDSARFRQVFQLKLADDLFFHALMIAAISEALADDSYDHIIVGFGSNPKFYEVIASDPTLFDDPRVDCCCLLPLAAARREFSSRLARARMRERKDGSLPYMHKLKQRLQETNPAADQLDVLGRAIIDFASSQVFPDNTPNDKERKRVLMLTAQQPAYLGSALSIAADWAEEFDVDIGFLGGSSQAIDQYFETPGKEHPLSKSLTFLDLRLAKKKLPGMAGAWGDTAERLSVRAIQKLFEKHHDDRLACLTLDFMVPRVLRGVVPTVAALITLGDRAIRSRNYALVAACPTRSPRCLPIITAARHHGVPSLTIEPHALNATYIRYGTIQTDYSTAISHYFAAEYDSNFGIPADRCFMVGSPRVGRPKDFDPQAARKLARKELDLDDGRLVVTFISQPIAWPALSDAWAEVVKAATSLPRDVRLLLKTHPEDNTAAIQRYLSVAHNLGSEGIVEIATGDAKQTLDASDLVLTCYSVMAMEATVREVNVAIVTTAGREYPMPYHEVLDIPLCESAEDIIAVIRRSGRNAETPFLRELQEQKSAYV